MKFRHFEQASLDRQKERERESNKKGEQVQTKMKAQIERGAVEKGAKKSR